MTGSLETMVSYVKGRANVSPATAVVLGSGLGHMAENVEGGVKVPYGDIPGYPQPTVEGHSGELILGNLRGEKVVMASGRFHLYEGWDLETVILPIKLFHELGVKNLILTNSAGSVRVQNGPGTLMAITAHLDFTYQESSDTPLIVNEDRYHSAGLLHIAGESAERNSIDLKEGVYAWALGPSYETPAEIDLIRELGGHAVGMSTVPEIRAAGELGMNILTISCLTNYAAGVVEAPITHEEVIASAAEAGERFGTLLTSIIEHIGETE